MPRFTCILPFLITGLLSAQESPNEVLFSDGKASICLPPGYTFKPKLESTTIAIYPPNKTLFELLLTYNSVLNLYQQRSDIVEVAVRNDALNKNLQTHYLPGTKWLIVISPTTNKEINGQKEVYIHRVIALKTGYVTVTLGVKASNYKNNEFQYFLNNDFEKILSTLLPKEF